MCITPVKDFALYANSVSNKNPNQELNLLPSRPITTNNNIVISYFWYLKTSIL